MQGHNFSVQVQSVILHTSSSLCNIDCGAPAPVEVPKRKLRRMAGGNPEALGRAGQNFRVFTLENPCLLCEYTSRQSGLTGALLSISAHLKPILCLSGARQALLGESSCRAATPADSGLPWVAT